MKKEYDFIVIGQGLAGTCLTAELERLNQSVLVIDSSKLPSASMVAGGLFNPITGRSMVLTWKATALFPFLVEFYSGLESLLGDKFLTLMPLYRPFSGNEELNEWQGRLAQEKFKPFIKKIHTKPVFTSLVNNPVGGVELNATGFLNAARLIKSYRQYLNDKGCYLDDEYNSADVNFNSKNIVYKGYSASKLILANGPLGFNDIFVDKIRFQALKGEVLQLELGDNTEVILNRNAFVIPRDGKHIAGSNYDPKGNDWNNTRQAREEILDKVGKFLKPKVKVISQKAGLRPTTHDRRPVIGIHPKYPKIGVFNGLGTKGVSLAPYFARQFAENLVHGSDLDLEVTIERYFN